MMMLMKTLGILWELVSGHPCRFRRGQLMTMKLVCLLKQSDEGVWLTRPLTPKVTDAACKNVMHLCRLRCALMERMVAGMGLYAGINYYVHSQRELSDEAYQERVVTHS